MFCPKCGAEYRSGFTTCADCGVALVADPPESPTPEDPGDFVEVFSSSNQGEIAFVKSLLEEEGILYIAQGETAGKMLFGVTRVSFLVPETKREEAIEILNLLL
ncbi:MAG: DUF2007 domain-containing protein [Smithellaceae bacterium]|nr:DUF2007 domain-containing protein [Smithellaceae bacterium]